MMSVFIAFISGLIFAVGLVVSGMTNPEVVKGFLDILGDWNPALVFVMGGAVGVNFFTFKFLEKRKPMCAPAHFLPDNKDIDRKLAFGSVMFGLGWGLLGVCPGPGLVNLVTLQSGALLFVGSMLAGMFAFKLWTKP